eukprot:CAMPEP_0116057808 /NCGR_PEP_ID=MMETSP0322-20121206/4829_1 /TAXON_ID=163516 /ORGANISM="Leptocylindrus danicus var. apora, Strain B651" /LENGTH=622 /DNA_ID=CAMNT_0003541885 /DNA_START=149 /DNA_END=2014 /DNA_ORIENTATION=-
MNYDGSNARGNNPDSSSLPPPPPPPSRSVGGGLAGSQPLVRNVESLGALPPPSGNVLAQSLPLSVSTKGGSGGGGAAVVDGSGNITNDNNNNVNNGTNRFPPPPPPPPSSSRRLPVVATDHPLASEEGIEVMKAPSPRKSTHNMSSTDDISIPRVLHYQPPSSNYDAVNAHSASVTPPASGKIASAPASAPLAMIRQRLQQHGMNKISGNVASAQSGQPIHRHTHVPPNPAAVAAMVQASGRSKTLEESVDEFMEGSSCSVPELIENGTEDNVNLIQALYVYESRRSWRDVIRVSSQILDVSKSSPYCSFYEKLCQNSFDDLRDQGFELTTENETLMCISIRLKAFTRLQQYTDLAKDLEVFTKINQSLLPFWFRINILKSMQYVSSSSLSSSIDSLNDLLTAARTISDKVLCLSSISNFYQRNKKHRLALKALDDIIELLDSFSIQDLNDDLIFLLTTKDVTLDEGTKELFHSSLVAASFIEVHSRQGRIFLQLGALSEASVAFSYAQNHRQRILEAQSASGKSPIFKTLFQNSRIIVGAIKQLGLNEGLLLFANQNFSESMEKFQSLIDNDRMSKVFGMASDRNFFNDFWLDSTNLTQPAVNNMSLCALYTSNIEQAIHW